MEMKDNRLNDSATDERWKGDYLLGCFGKSLDSADKELTEALERYRDVGCHTMALECERLKSGIDGALVQLDRIKEGASR